MKMTSLKLLPLAAGLALALTACGGSAGPKDIAVGDQPTTTPQSSTPDTTAPDMQAWATAWCTKAKPGMSPAALEAIMGPATEELDDSLSWSYRTVQLNAFLDTSGTISQLDTNMSQMTAAEKAMFSCPKTRTAD